jgi:hypothetical protein
LRANAALKSDSAILDENLRRKLDERKDRFALALALATSMLLVVVGASAAQFSAHTYISDQRLRDLQQTIQAMLFANPTAGSKDQSRKNSPPRRQDGPPMGN